MAIVVLLCLRDNTIGHDYQKSVELLADRLLPDNIVPTPPLVVRKNGALLGILNPNESVLHHGCSACVGNLVGRQDDWWRPKTDRPDGAFALFRSDQQNVELITDLAASRTIWCAITRDMLVASTSQRAIVSLLRDYQPNREAYSWMLSVGTLGPGLSWDRRIKSLSARTALLLDRSTWDLSETSASIAYEVVERSEEEHEEALTAALRTTFDELDLDPTKWILTLSGGFDTRCILMMLKNRDGLRCATWGLESALGDRMNDAYIARQVADFYGLEHTYFRTEISEEDVDTIFRRFLVSGEGRVDRVGAYMDGFEMWKRMYEAGVWGIIRGDALGFTLRGLSTPFDVMQVVGAGLLSDYANLMDTGAFGLEEQVWPTRLGRRENESFASWLSRLGDEYRVTSLWGGLSKLKASYVEIVNPLLSRRVLDATHQLPDSCRIEKRLFKKIVRSMSPDIPFARRPAVSNYADILKSPRVVAHVAAELNTGGARDLLSDDLIDLVLSQMIVDDRRWRSITEPMSSRIKQRVLKRLDALSRKDTPKPMMDFNVMAFRAYIISRMHRILSDDAHALGWIGSKPPDTMGGRNSGRSR
jgi:hypothetical protein